VGKHTELNSVGTLITGDYQIIYEIIEKTILIVMVWDCRRNPEDMINPNPKRK